MANNLPDNLKTNWVDNETVMPVNVNGWSSAINKIKDAVPVYSANGNFYTATYGSNIYSLSPITMNGETNVPPSAYIDGMKVVFKCPTNNSANCSVNVNSLGNKSIKNLDGSNIGAGVLVAGNYIELIYDNSQGYFKLLTAHYLPISSVAGKGSASLPVYFDANGKAQPITSYQGNSASATIAQKDQNGDVIDETYAKNENLFDKMNQSKAMETGSVSYVEEVLQDVIKYKNSSFDASKFTKVGNAIITDDGIMSVQAKGNYVRVSDFSFVNGFTLKGQFTGVIVSTSYCPVAFGSGYYDIGSGKGFGIFVTGNYIGLNIHDLSNNNLLTGTVKITSSELGLPRSDTAMRVIDYYVDIKGTNVTFKAKADNGEWVTKTGTLTGNYALSNVQLQLGGTAWANNANIVTDLKQISITVDGVEVFNGHQEGIDVLKPNDFTTVTTIYAYKFGDNTVYSNVTNNTNPTELYNADGSYYLGTAFDIINDKVTYPEQATRGADDITIEGVTYYEFEHSSTNIYADDPTTPTALFNSDGSEYTGTQWNIMSSKVYYLNDATYTSSDNITINRDYNTVDAGVKISEDGIASGFSNNTYIKKELTINTNNLVIEGEFIFTNTATKSLFCFGQNYTINIYVNAGGLLKVDIGSGTTSTWDILENAEFGQTYTYNKYTFKLKIENNKVETYLNGLLMHEYNVNNFSINQSEFYIGFRKPINSNPFIGEINLNAFKIYANGNLVYQPMLRIPYIQSASKYGSKIVDEQYRDRVEDAYEQGFEQKYFTLQENKNKNYISYSTVVVDNNGVASGFGSSASIHTKDFVLRDLQGKSWAVEGSLYWTNDTSVVTGSAIMIPIKLSNSWMYKGSIRVYTSGTWELLLQTGDLSEYSQEGAKIRLTNASDTVGWYKWRLEYDKNTGTYTLKVGKYTDEGYPKSDSFTATTTNKEMYEIYNIPHSDMVIGQGSDVTYNATQIDLKAFKLYIEDELVWTPFTEPNFTLPLGELYGLIESKVPKTSLSEVICIVEDYTYEDASAFCWDLSNGIRIQGATQTVSANGEMTVPLLKNFADNHYLAFKNYSAGVSSAMQDSEGSIYDKTISNFKTSNSTGDTTKFDWIAIGRIG